MNAAMNDKNVNFKILLCIFGFIPLVQCRFHTVPRNIKDELQPRPYVPLVRPYLRHNTMYDLPSTAGAAEPSKPGDEIESGLEDAKNLDKDNGTGQDDARGKGNPREDNNISPGKPTKDFCWFAINSTEHFREMDELDEKHSEARERYKKLMGSSNFDEDMLNKMLASRSIAERALQNYGGQANMVPAGLDLGGSAMMRMPQSVLFFHRLKLRNNTRFTVNFLHNDLQQMSLTVRISMHDLHLTGNYERVVTMDKDPSILFYKPTSGEVEFLLKDVEYAMEGRYRLLYDRLNIEHVISQIKPNEILMKFTSEPTKKPLKLERFSFEDYMLRIQNDLDSWLRDYFNDFLMYFGLAGAGINDAFQLYENEKTIAMNRFADEVVTQMRRRLRDVNASAVKIPSFKIFGISGLKMTLSRGVVRGLDSLYRCSAATGKRQDNVRYVDADVAFSNLKVEYQYEAVLRVGLPPMFGMLVLTADELTAHMAVGVVRDKDSIDLDFRLLKEPKSQSLTIEGSANRVVANFKHLLEHHITAIMSNALTNVLQQLGSVTRCYPYLHGIDGTL